MLCCGNDCTIKTPCQGLSGVKFITTKSVTALSVGPCLPIIYFSSGPQKPSVLSDSDDEPEPDSRIQVPTNKVRGRVGR